MEQNPPVWMDGTTVPGEDLRRLTTALMSDGVAKASALAVSEKSGTPNMSVDVAAGAAFVLGTNQTYQGTYFVENRATVNKTISAAHPTNGRIDLVVARVRENLYDSGGVDAWDIYVVTGTPAGSPVAPAVPDNCLLLATVNVAAAASSILNANITSARTLARPWNSAWGTIVHATDPNLRSGFTTSVAEVNAALRASLPGNFPANRKLRFTCHVNVGINTGTPGVLLTLRDLTAGADVGRFWQQNASVGSAISHTGSLIITSVAGARTWTPRVQAVIGGTLDVNGHTDTSYMLLEDIGPA